MGQYWIDQKSLILFEEPDPIPKLLAVKGLCSQAIAWIVHRALYTFLSHYSSKVQTYVTSFLTSHTDVILPTVLCSYPLAKPETTSMCRLTSLCLLMKRNTDEQLECMHEKVALCPYRQAARPKIVAKRSKLKDRRLKTKMLNKLGCMPIKIWRSNFVVSCENNSINEKRCTSWKSFR